LQFTDVIEFDQPKFIHDSALQFGFGLKVYASTALEQATVLSMRFVRCSMPGLAYYPVPLYGKSLAKFYASISPLAKSDPDALLKVMNFIGKRMWCIDSVAHNFISQVAQKYGEANQTELAEKKDLPYFASMCLEDDVEDITPDEQNTHASNVIRYGESAADQLLHIQFDEKQTLVQHFVIPDSVVAFDTAL